jgi:Na+-driven multidrug efflux pump
MNKKQVIYSILFGFLIVGVLRWLGLPSAEQLLSLFGEPTLLKAITITIILALLIFMLFKIPSKKTQKNN